MSMSFGGGGGHYDALLQQLDRQRQMRAQRPMMQPMQPVGGEVQQMRPAQFGPPQAASGGGGMMGGAMGGLSPQTLAGMMKQGAGMFGGGSDLGSRMPSMWERMSGTGMGGPIQTYGVGATPIGGGY